MDVLSPTQRTSVTRIKNRAATDREQLFAFLGEALVAHLGVIATTADGHAYPVVLPTAFGIDRDGPDDGGSLYLHGSVAAGWLSRALAGDVCVTVTELDGLVVARSAFHHSMNYRSAVIIGRPRCVEDPRERESALARIVDHIIPDRSATLRPNSPKELAATAVIAVPLVEASMKQRTGGPVDEPADIEADIWAGHIPLHRIAGLPVPDADSHGRAPDDVQRRLATL